MSAGLRITNDHNTVQIDQDSFTLAFHSKGSITLGTRVGDVIADVDSTIKADTYNTWINTNGVGYPPGWGGSSSLLAFRSLRKVGIGFGPESTGAQIQFIGRHTSSIVVDWWYFTRPAPRSSGVGLEIYTADGQVAYANDGKIMKLGAVENDTLGGVSAPYTSNWWAISIGTPFPGVGNYIYSGDIFHYQEMGAFFQPHPTLGWNTFNRFTEVMGARTSTDTSQLGIGSGNVRATPMMIDVQGL